MHRLLLALAICVPSGCAQQKFATTAPVSKAPIVDPGVPLSELIEFDVVAGNRYVKSDAAGEVTIRLRVRTTERPNAARTPANVGLVIDTSASMRGEPIEQARQAALAMLDALELGDQITVVAFHSRADLLVPTTVITEAERPKLRKAIESMQATGTTALAQGLQAVVQHVSGHARPDMINRVVLLSDGVPNDETEVRNIAAQAGQQSISITALGLGLDYQEALLADIAVASRGRFHYIEDADQIATVFHDEVLHLERMLAQGSSLALRAGPGVRVLSVVGRPDVPVNGQQVSFYVGDLAENATKDVIVKLAIGPHRSATTVELLDATLTYQDPSNPSVPGMHDAFLAVEATDDDAQRQTGIDPDVALVAAKASIAAETLQIVDRARSGDIKGANAQLHSAEKRAKKLVAANKDDELTKLSTQLSALKGNLATIASTQPEPVAAPPAVGPGNAFPMDVQPRSQAADAGSMALKKTHSDAFNIVN